MSSYWATPFSTTRNTSAANPLSATTLNCARFTSRGLGRDLHSVGFFHGILERHRAAFGPGGRVFAGVERLTGHVQPLGQERLSQRNQRHAVRFAQRRGGATQPNCPFWLPAHGRDMGEAGQGHAQAPRAVHRLDDRQAVSVQGDGPVEITFARGDEAQKKD